MNGVVTLRQAVVKRSDVFVRTMTEKLLIYALGRGLTSHDMPVVRGIVRNAARQNYKFSTLVLGIVNSAPFQMRIKPGARARAGEGRYPVSRESSNRRAAAMFITKMSLSRRTFLRGAGVTVALPFLESMVPAMTATVTRRRRTPRKRFGAIYIPHGAIMDQWTPPTVGKGFDFMPILKPLEAFKESHDHRQQPGAAGRRDPPTRTWPPPPAG